MVTRLAERGCGAALLCCGLEVDGSAGLPGRGHMPRGAMRPGRKPGTPRSRRRASALLSGHVRAFSRPMARRTRSVVVAPSPGKRPGSGRDARIRRRPRRGRGEGRMRPQYGYVPAMRLAIPAADRRRDGVGLPASLRCPHDAMWSVGCRGRSVAARRRAMRRDPVLPVPRDAAAL